MTGQCQIIHSPGPFQLLSLLLLPLMPLLLPPPLRLFLSSGSLPLLFLLVRAPQALLRTRVADPTELQHFLVRLQAAPLLANLQQRCHAQGLGQSAVGTVPTGGRPQKTRGKMIHSHQPSRGAKRLAEDGTRPIAASRRVLATEAILVAAVGTPQLRRGHITHAVLYMKEDNQTHPTHNNNNNNNNNNKTVTSKPEVNVTKAPRLR